MNIARFHSFIAIGTIAMITIGFAKFHLGLLIILPIKVHVTPKLK